MIGKRKDSFIVHVIYVVLCMISSFLFLCFRCHGVFLFFFLILFNCAFFLFISKTHLACHISFSLSSSHSPFFTLQSQLFPCNDIPTKVYSTNDSLLIVWQAGRYGLPFSYLVECMHNTCHAWPNIRSANSSSPVFRLGWLGAYEHIMDHILLLLADRTSLGAPSWITW